MSIDRFSRRLSTLFLVFITMSAAIAETGPIVPAFRIASVEYEIDGITRPYALALAAEISIGTEFPDRSALDAYVADRQQVLLNERVLASVEITVEEKPVVEGQPIPVSLIIRVKDTWNIIALPYFKYDSNSGLLLSIRARDYNFLGSMEPLKFDANFEYDENGKVSWSGEGEFSIPFSLDGRDLSWDTTLGVTLPEDQNVDIAFSTGLSLQKRLGDRRLEIGLTQGLNLNDRDEDGLPYADVFYAATKVKASLALPMVDMGQLGSLDLVPTLSLSWNWNPTGLSDSDLYGPSLSVGESLAFGRVDWIGNFRRGLAGSLDATLAFNFYDSSIARSASFGMQGYLPFQTRDPWLGMLARVGGFFQFDEVDDEAGGDLRGILNNRISTKSLFYFNGDFQVRILRFQPAEWFGISWMRFFEFDQVWSPFLDIGLARNETTGAFSPSDAWAGGGLQILTYPRIMRSIFIRIMIGWDVRDVLATKRLTGSSPRDGKGIYEIFFGLGNHY